MSSRRWRKLEQVVCRQESRPDERPLKFRLQGDWIQVDRVLSTRLERGPAEHDPAFRVFEIESNLGRHLLRVPVDGWVWEALL